MAETVEDIIAGLWENGRDSIAHALYHFSERDHELSKRWHHNKWIVLSVHHAAECVCNMRLLELNPTCSIFENKGKRWFPPLPKSISELEKIINPCRLSKSEVSLLGLLKKISITRNELMHRNENQELDVSISAMCMIGILKYIEMIKGEGSVKIVWQSPPIESYVVSAIHYSKLDEYSKFVESFVCEKYPDQYLPCCPSCGVHAVVSSICEACFEEVSSVMCSNCGEKIYFMSWEKYHGDHIVKCQECGAEQAL